MEIGDFLKASKFKFLGELVVQCMKINCSIIILMKISNYPIVDFSPNFRKPEKSNLQTFIVPILLMI